MKRTLTLVVVAAAVATMIALGVWQLRRAEWKETMLAELALAADAPPLEIGDGPIPPQADFRRASIRLRCPDRLDDPRAGRNAAGQTGWLWRAACRTAVGEPVSVVAGWSGSAERPQGASLPREAVLSGVLVPSADTRSFYLTSAPAPLQPAAPPSAADIPNNHLAYAVQWFAFALTALIVSFLALRRRRG